MDSVLAAVIRQAVLDRLDQLDHLVPTSAHLRLTAAWRALLAQHQPGADDCCRLCAGRRSTRRFPCPVWTIAREYLLGRGQA
jgi:hypothetical protein